jgi:hypothetical protein
VAFQGRKTAAASRRPGERPPSCAHPRGPRDMPWPWGACHRLCVSSTQPGSQRPFDLPRSAATERGCGGRCPPAAWETTTLDVRHEPASFPCWRSACHYPLRCGAGMGAASAADNACAMLNAPWLPSQRWAKRSAADRSPLSHTSTCGLPARNPKYEGSLRSAQASRQRCSCRGRSASAADGASPPPPQPRPGRGTHPLHALQRPHGALVPQGWYSLVRLD